VDTGELFNAPTINDFRVTGDFQDRHRRAPEPFIDLTERDAQ
jgi:hypothetical protein